MSPDGASNIRVFIRWHEQTVFAGEEVKCSITFKNVASPPGSSSKSSPQPRLSLADGSRQASPLRASAARGKANSHGGLAPPAAGHGGHRSSHSLSVPSAAAASRARSRAGSIPWSPKDVVENRAPVNGHKHKRSVSIVSIGSATTVDDQQSNAGSTRSQASQRPLRGHARASSLQIVPRGGAANGPRSATQPHRPYNSQSSPLFNASYPPNASRTRPSGASTVPNTPGLGISLQSPGSGSDGFSDFKFPATQSPMPGSNSTSPRMPDEPFEKNTQVGDEPVDLPVRTKDLVPQINEHSAAPTARVLATTSIAGTPRSSGEFYSISNNSTETLASEYVTQQPLRTHGRPHLRRQSGLSSNGQGKLPEALMMGYAQIQGSFMLDGSLVSLTPFEAVKRKAVVGGQGGGVVGIETKRDSGLFKGFGWSNLTTSIGDFLGAGELSTIKEMRGIASSRSVPLLSTPQSILFVDLQLGPGESKTFEYSFRLPKGLPPTHRGKAMKISYSLVIGTQRPGGSKEQQVKSVEIPFRVLGSVNSHGEILGHDLMSPYIILHDQARIKSIDRGNSHEVQQKGRIQPATATMNSFLSYVDELLSRRREGSGAGLLSPTAMPSSRRPSTYSMFDDPGATSAREAIDLAILRSNVTGEGQQSANRFEIARNGRRVGVVMLTRPAYRVGEAVTLAVDFTGAEIPCYAVHSALETAERVDPSLAVRSDASIHRVTRKVYVTASEATLFARRIVFTPTIPVTATPEFVTSGVSLEWKIRLEFVVPAQEGREDVLGDEGNIGAEDGGGGGRGALGSFSRPGQDETPHALLEEMSLDERGGLVLVAAENLACESFEVAVPLRVYGAVCNGLERLERDEALEEGLSV